MLSRENRKTRKEKNGEAYFAGKWIKYISPFMYGLTNISTLPDGKEAVRKYTAKLFIKSDSFGKRRKTAMINGIVSSKNFKMIYLSVSEIIRYALWCKITDFSSVAGLSSSFLRRRLFRALFLLLFITSVYCSC